MRSKKRTKGKHRVLKSIGLILLAGILLFTSLQLYVVLYSAPQILDSLDKLDGIKKPQAILVLGAGVYASGKPTPVLKDRLDYAYQIYEHYDRRISIIVSGDNKTVEYNETKAMYDYLVNKGVDSTDVYGDFAGFNTYDSLYRANYIFQAKSLIICTQKFHIYRSVFIAKKLGFEAYGYPSDNKSIYNMTFNHIRESMARIKAVLDADILKRQPKYLGDPIPIKVYD